MISTVNSETLSDFNDEDLHDRFSGHRWWWGVFMAALLVRLCTLGQIRLAPFFGMTIGDALSYDTWAREIADGNVMGDSVFYQAPLYPYLLAALYRFVGSQRIVVVVVQALLGATSCVLLGRASAAVSTWRAGIATGLIAAGFAPAVFFDCLIQKSSLDLFLLCLLIWLLTRIDAGNDVRLVFIAGLVGGAFMLTRENSIAFLMAMGVWLVSRFRHAPSDLTRSLLALAVGTTCVLLPVAARNQLVGGEFHLTTSQFGPNFYIGNNQFANGMYQPLLPGGGNAKRERLDAMRLAERAAGRSLSPGEVSQYWTRRTIAEIQEHPGAWLRLMGDKFVLLWNRTEITDTEDIYTYAEWSAMLAILLPVFNFGNLIPLAVPGVFLSWNQRPAVSGLLLMIGTYAASVMMFYVLSRYRYPLFPLLAIFAGRTISEFPNRLRTNSRGSVMVTLMATIVAAVFCNWPIVESDHMKSITHYNIALEFESRGDDDAASEFYEQTIVLNPVDVDAFAALGELRIRQHRLRDAERQFRSAILLDPDRPLVHFQLANVYARLNRVVAAIDEYKATLRIAPEFAPAHANLGIAYQQTGDIEQAIRSLKKAVACDAFYIPAKLNLAHLLADQDRFEEAAIHYKSVLAIDPNHQTAQAALQFILGRLP